MWVGRVGVNTSEDGIWRFFFWRDCRRAGGSQATHETNYKRSIKEGKQEQGEGQANTGEESDDDLGKLEGKEEGWGANKRTQWRHKPSRLLFGVGSTTSSSFKS